MARAEVREAATVRHQSVDGGKIAARGRKFGRRATASFQRGAEGWGPRGVGAAWRWSGREGGLGVVSGGSGSAAVCAGGGVARATLKGGGVGVTRNGVADRWAGTRQGPGH
jgi:hypothetical protein